MYPPIFYFYLLLLRLQFSFLLLFLFSPWCLISFLLNLYSFIIFSLSDMTCTAVHVERAVVIIYLNKNKSLHRELSLQQTDASWRFHCNELTVKIVKACTLFFRYCCHVSTWFLKCVTKCIPIFVSLKIRNYIGGTAVAYPAATVKLHSQCGIIEVSRAMTVSCLVEVYQHFGGAFCLSRTDTYFRQPPWSHFG